MFTSKHQNRRPVGRGRSQQIRRFNSIERSMKFFSHWGSVMGIIAVKPSQATPVGLGRAPVWKSSRSVASFLGHRRRRRRRWRGSRRVLQTPSNFSQRVAAMFALLLVRGLLLLVPRDAMRVLLLWFVRLRSMKWVLLGLLLDGVAGAKPKKPQQTSLMLPCLCVCYCCPPMMR